MENFLRFPLDMIPFVFLVLLIAFTFHEFAHAYFADKFGDPTPRSMGRVTLNPRVHLDLLGTILIFVVGFGWAKPVLVRRSSFRNPRVMSVIVSAAGPLSNLIIAFIGVLLTYVLAYFGWFETMSPGVFEAVRVFLSLLIYLNLILFLFNLLPLPPLDGYRIIQEFLPMRVRLKLQQYEQWAFFIILLLVFVRPLYNVTLGAVFSLMPPLLFGMDSVCQMIFGKAIHWASFLKIS
ncbi:site-2 protease family protein [Paenibacillus sp. J2TS4]|uniref:site-2 protease family protein n=1 Tax=Paenibacillus sp. J2TS4 TaxID=2807194 RepID=UPI001B0B3F93|nr:site-2 protease family protein [Paenibacillus sp. J2TS4]GIP35850.1 zinc metalloprotease [Paenibacillus sp. J2TS4]